MRYAITGGAGFIGSNLVQAIIRAGDEAIVIDNFAAVKREDRIVAEARYVEADITDAKYHWKDLDGADVLIHLAALPRVQYSMSNPIETMTVNVVGTSRALVAAREHSVGRFVFAASSSAYGDHGDVPLREDMAAQPQSPYALQKYFGEQICRMWNSLYGMQTVSLRFFSVYGPLLDPHGDYALVIGKFLAQKRSGLPLTVTGDGEQSRDFTHVSDVVGAILLASKSKNVGNGEIINIGAGRSVSINDLASMFQVPSVHIEPRKEPRHTLADVSLARRLLGWEPTVRIEDGLKELLKLNSI